MTLDIADGHEGGGGRTCAAVELRDYQQAALTGISELWSSGHTRATVQLPCGTGKTLVAVHAIELGRAHRVLIFVPTLALLAQTIDVLSQHLPGHEVVAVCHSAAFSPEAHLPEIADMGRVEDVVATGVAVTTDPEEIAGHLRTTHPVAVLSTYASAPAIAEAAANWDVMICDEAHRTAGVSDKAWAIPLDNERIHADRRLFLTATPRQIKVNPEQEDETGQPVSVASMSDPALYGPILCPLSFRDAISQGWLSDYRIAVVVVAEHEVASYLDTTVDDDGYPIDVTTAATQIAVLRAARKHDIRAALVFHNTIDASVRWERQFRRVARDVLDASAVSEEERVDAWCTHIDGTSSPRWRTMSLKRLEAPPENTLNVLSNCRVFSEGVDLPALDAVVLAEPRASGPDIVQIVGRAIRPHPEGNHKPAVIVLPVIIREADRAAATETIVARTGWLAAWQVLTTLAHEDTHLFEGLAAARAAGERRPNDAVGIEEHTRGRVSIDTDLARGLGQAFRLRLLRRTTSSWVVLAHRVREFAAEYGHTHPRPGYELDDGYPLGRQVRDVRDAYAKGRLIGPLIDMFDAIPHWEWTQRKRRGSGRTFDQWMVLVRSHVARTQIRRIHTFEQTPDPESDNEMVPIGRWIRRQVARWRHLTPQQQAALSDVIDVDWHR